MEKYFKIYFWQVTSIVLNFVSLFIVTPYLSSNPTIYGIYMIVISALIFLSYADLGFLSAGIKFGSESYARGNLEEETRIIGFAGFVLLLFALVFAAVLFYCAYSPEILIGHDQSLREITISRNLLIILALFVPVIALQRIIQVIFAVRMQDYQFQKLMILSNFLKILAIFVFFRNGKYAIVEYFIFSQCCTLLAVLAGFVIIRLRVRYNLRLFFSSIRYSPELFNKTKSLAFSSILLTISWIAYYELDNFAIGRMLGPEKVAIYSIGLSLTAYFRSLFGVLFSPFTARFNYFMGHNDMQGFRDFFFRLLVIAFPFTVLPVTTFIITAQPIVFGWVGLKYTASIPIVQLLIGSYIFSFLSYPASILIMAIQKNKLIVLTSLMLPIIYWTGIVIFFKQNGLMAFAWFKFITFAVMAIIYLVIILNWMQVSFAKIFTSFLFAGLLSAGIMAFLLHLLCQHIHIPPDKKGLFLILLINGGACAVGLLIYYLSCPKFKTSIQQILQSLQVNLKNRFA